MTIKIKTNNGYVFDKRIRVKQNNYWNDVKGIYSKANGIWKLVGDRIYGLDYSGGDESYIYYYRDTYDSEFKRFDSSSSSDISFNSENLPELKNGVHDLVVLSKLPLTFTKGKLYSFKSKMYVNEININDYYATINVALTKEFNPNGINSLSIMELGAADGKESDTGADFWSRDLDGEYYLAIQVSLSKKYVALYSLTLWINYLNINGIEVTAY